MIFLLDLLQQLPMDTETIAESVEAGILPAHELGTYGDDRSVRS
jgi:hypothetical protein